MEEEPRASAPASPVIGSCYIIADNASGDWQAREGQLAAYTSGGWRYLAPVEGMTMHVRSSAETATYRNGGWELGLVRGSALVIGANQVVGSRAGAISEPSGGAQVDVEARSAIGAILTALRQHGLIAS